MPSDKEMRVWVIGILVHLWVALGWPLYDQLCWSPEGPPAEVLHQFQQRVQLLAYGVMAIVGLMTLLMTRLAYCALRAPRQDEEQSHV